MQQNTINCTHYFSTFQIFLTFIICGEFFPHDNLSCGEFLHLTICHVDKFLHMTKNFSTGTARGARDKYEVCAYDDFQSESLKVSEMVEAVMISDYRADVETSLSLAKVLMLMLNI